ncbi:Uncharacterised protein [Mycobacteroides abscessus subsp. abscessus]|nr:Uncharacterised protein [Mycobacteroides abscessus subsp. abscessus]
MPRVSRWAKDTAVRPTPMTIVVPIPSWPTEMPDRTLVTMKARPWTTPTRPFARARSSGSIRIVTVVDNAMLRMDPRPGEIGDGPRGGEEEHRSCQQEHAEREDAGDLHHGQLAEPVDQGAEADGAD